MLSYNDSLQVGTKEADELKSVEGFIDDDKEREVLGRIVCQLSFVETWVLQYTTSWYPTYPRRTNVAAQFRFE